MNQGHSDTKLGYYFYHRRYPHSPGHPGLEIHIYDSPTFLHFDPRQLLIPAAGIRPHGSPGPCEQLGVQHPWPFGNQYRACAGGFKVIDRIGKSVDAFSFGGTLSVHSEESLTTCLLESPAPILAVGSDSAIPTILAEECEIILAERRAAWLKERNFNEHLAATDPLKLYIACLSFLRKKYQGNLHMNSPHYISFFNFLNEEIIALRGQGLWPFLTPEVDEIL
jgi:hypothetical protein